MIPRTSELDFYLIAIGGTDSDILYLKVIRNKFHSQQSKGNWAFFTPLMTYRQVKG